MLRLILLWLISLSFTSSVSVSAATATIVIQDFVFNPNTITLNVGDSVTWINQDGATLHSTTQDTNLWSSDLGQGGSFSFTFNNPGTYTYFCRFHQFMRGKIDVSSQGNTNQILCFFNWVEVNYFQFFSPSGNISLLTFPPYTYRYYSQTNSYLAVSSVDNHVYYMSGSDGVIHDIGEFSAWLSTSGCQ